ncbi:MAG: preprotein translocase subunit SecG [Bacteroidales bacterium]|nr:preprotein translocase subunit SecG [Bacteroidales bacterium]
MYVFISILILVICVLLGLIVLVQNPKGGGLAANFSGGTQFMGARQTADFLEKASWGLAIALLVLSLTATMIIPRNSGTTSNQQNSELQNMIDHAKKPEANFMAPPVTQQPAAKTTTPEKGTKK